MKTHYQALGINEEADDEVIVAAYKALAKKYHPDTYAGDKKFAEERMKEINIAYGVLSDKAKRKKYDEEIKSKKGANEFDEEDEFSDSEDGEAALKEDWEILTQIFAEAEICRQYLHRISSTLSFNYQVFIIASKKGEEAVEIALGIERVYLEKYFGKNAELKKIAKASLVEKNKQIAKDINKKVSLLGNDASVKILKDVRKRFSSEIDYFKKGSFISLEEYCRQRGVGLGPWTKSDQGASKTASKESNDTKKSNENETNKLGLYEWSILLLIFILVYYLCVLFVPMFRN